jgi:hypothetical protein
MLSRSEVELFYKLTHSLQFHVVQQTGVVSGISTLQEFIDADFDDKIAAREALYEDPALFDSFVATNPEHFGDEDLDLIRSWKKLHIAGSFFIERHLRSHSIWIGAGPEGDEAYAVLGLSQPLEEIVPKAALPQSVKAVLLPFKGRIVFDGILHSYRVSFGPGYRASLRDTYLRAKQNGRIVASLDPADAPAPAPALSPARDWSRELASLKRTAAKLKGEKSPLAKEAFAVCRSSIELVETTIASAGDLDRIRDHGRAVTKALFRLERVLDRAE